MGTVENKTVGGKNYVCVVVRPKLKGAVPHNLKKDPEAFVEGAPSGEIKQVCYPAERGIDYAIDRIPKILEKDAEGCKLCKVGGHSENPKPKEKRNYSSHELQKLADAHYEERKGGFSCNSCHFFHNVFCDHPKIMTNVRYYGCCCYWRGKSKWKPMAGNPYTPGQINKYVAFYGDKQIVVEADSSYHAQLKAIDIFKPPKSKKHLVTVILEGSTYYPNPPKTRTPAMSMPKAPPYSVIYMKSDRGISGWYCRWTDSINEAMKCMKSKPVIIPSGKYSVYEVKGNFVLLATELGDSKAVYSPSSKHFYLVKKDHLAYFYAVDMFKPVMNAKSNPNTPDSVTVGARFVADQWIKEFKTEKEVLDFIPDLISGGYTYHSYFDEPLNKWVVHFKHRPAVSAPKPNPCVDCDTLDTNEAYENPRAKPEDIQRAYELGIRAFQQGYRLIPAQDPALMYMIKGYKVGEGTALLKAWHKGYMHEQLRGPATTNPDMSTLTGKRLKNALGADRVKKRYENKHVDGSGNFGYVVVMPKHDRYYTIDGEYNSDRKITELRIGTFGTQTIEDEPYIRNIRLAIKNVLGDSLVAENPEVQAEMLEYPNEKKFFYQVLADDFIVQLNKRGVTKYNKLKQANATTGDEEYIIQWKE